MTWLQSFLAFLTVVSRALIVNGTSLRATEPFRLGPQSAIQPSVTLSPAQEEEEEEVGSGDTISLLDADEVQSAGRYDPIVINTDQSVAGVTTTVAPTTATATTAAVTSEVWSTTTTTSVATTTSTAATANRTGVLPLPESATCEPACVEGRGVCNDHVCFCKHPHTGTQCQFTARNDEFIRISYALVVVISLIALMVGTVLASLVFICCVEAKNKLTSYGKVSSRSETWKPGKSAGLTS